jgi:hypothetical protein
MLKRREAGIASQGVKAEGLKKSAEVSFIEATPARKPLHHGRQVVRSRQIQPRGKSLPDLVTPIQTRLSLQVSSNAPPHMQLQVNAWERLDMLSPAQLMSSWPASMIERDIKGIHQIEEKSNQISRTHQRKRGKQLVAREALRASLAKLHEKSAELEQKSGVVKVRDLSLERSADSMQSSLYGFSRTFLVSPRTELLSRPRLVHCQKEPLKHFDFRGMISADFASVISIFKPKLSSPDLSPVRSSPYLTLNRLPSSPNLSSMSQLGSPKLSPIKKSVTIVKPAKLRRPAVDFEDWQKSIDKVELICKSTPKGAGYSKADLVQFYRETSGRNKW